MPAPRSTQSLPADLYSPATLGQALLDWYDQNRRVLPWRALPGAPRDPYRVWLSEIMLQQTGVEAVKPYFNRFVARWPDIGALASCEDQALFTAWAGLGYYARARNLLRCARAIITEHGGRFPQDVAQLRALPGIGDYTAAAIAAIAFDQPALVVDGNVERVMTRFAALATPLPKAKAEIKAALAALMPETRPGDFAQSMMDLGSMICTPKSPSCMLCPLEPGCKARQAGTPLAFPVKIKKNARPIRFGAVFVVYDHAGRLLLRTRPDTGLLAKMSEVPGSDWSEDQSMADNRSAAPMQADWHTSSAIVRHVFTHFELRLSVYLARIAPCPPPDACRWVTPSELKNEPLPTLFLKVIAFAGKFIPLSPNPEA
jgi:A/G-specific adenine glycosylase